MSAPRKNYSRAVVLYEKRGLSIAQVAARFGISRQAMYQILRRRGVVFRSRVAGRAA